MIFAKWLRYPLPDSFGTRSCRKWIVSTLIEFSWNCELLKVNAYAIYLQLFSTQFFFPSSGLFQTQIKFFPEEGSKRLVESFSTEKMSTDAPPFSMSNSRKMAALYNTDSKNRWRWSNEFREHSQGGAVSRTLKYKRFSMNTGRKMEALHNTKTNQ